MDEDYQKDNFDELDKLLYKAASTFDKKLHGSITAFVGCTVSELKDVMHTTLKRLVPQDKVQTWIDEADRLIA